MLTKKDLADIKTLIVDALGDFYVQAIVPTFVTKEDLKEALKQFATKEDLRQLEGKMVTKDEYLTGQDQIMGELKNISEELVFLRHRVDDTHQPQLEDHETRITALESQSL